jgi:hypothetical protein
VFIVQPINRALITGVLFLFLTVIAQGLFEAVLAAFSSQVLKWCSKSFRGYIHLAFLCVGGFKNNPVLNFSTFIPYVCSA